MTLFVQVAPLRGAAGPAQLDISVLVWTLAQLMDPAHLTLTASWTPEPPPLHLSHALRYLPAQSPGPGVRRYCLGLRSLALRLWPSKWLGGSQGMIQCRGGSVPQLVFDLSVKKPWTNCWAIGIGRTSRFLEVGKERRDRVHHALER